jgi:hypothetical protein
MMVDIGKSVGLIRHGRILGSYRITSTTGVRSTDGSAARRRVEFDCAQA